MGVKTNSTPKLEIEEYVTGVSLISKISNSVKLRVNSRISKAQLQRLLAGGWTLVRKPPSQRGMKERARTGSYGRPITDAEVEAALRENYEGGKEE